MRRLNQILGELRSVILYDVSREIWESRAISASWSLESRTVEMKRRILFYD